MKLLGKYPPECRQSMTRIVAAAAAAGHDMTPFEPVADDNQDDNQLTPGYQTTCRKCKQTAWVDDAGAMYSLLDDTCRG